MAIKPCKECGSPVSDKAPTCPQCGAKQPKKTSKIALIFAGLMLFMVIIGLLSGEDNSENTQPVTEKENKAGVLLFYSQQQIKQNAKDPESVQFRGEQIHENTDSGAVACGEYNAKNSFGAYTGFKGFVAVEKDQTLYIEGGVNAKSFAEKWNKYCTK
ncbi:hypothetical protein [Acinetobacter sp. YH12140]|uniref:hypothetical protein n=1 Tax=Acinetobacter sp. YH12140 TaxID=2601124 RepID=UPI00211F3C0B|nr:hypothetical protein [Acinetobacter sp. YH12140]